jgi:anaerobic magnesium-protoporphyrin IX monomethyl ester cyclase
MNILLINAPSDKIGAVYNKLGMWIPGEQLGICYLAACLRREGHTVELLDGFLMGISPQEIAAFVLQRKEPLDVLGISISDGKVFGAVALIDALKELPATMHMTLGGHTATLCAREFLRDYPRIDSVVIGEGEATVIELCRHLEENSDWSQLPGLAVRRDGVPVKNGLAQLVDVDRLPFPSRDNLQFCEKTGFCVSIETSRGCKGVCSFCATRMMFTPEKGISWRARSVDNLLEEIERLKRNYGVTRISFEDEDFLGFGSSQGIDRAVRFAEEILRREIKFSWATLTRVDNVEEEVFTLLKRAGLELIFIGVENAEQRTLNRYRKGVTVDQNLRAIGILKKLDIPHEILWIMSDPYTEFSDIERNVEFVQKYATALNINLYNSLRVYHGTPLHIKLMNEGKLEGNYLEYHYGVDPKIKQFQEAIVPGIDGMYALMTKLNYVLWDRANQSPMAIAQAHRIAASVDELSKAYLGQVVEALNNSTPTDGLSAAVREKTMDLAMAARNLAK